MSQLLDARLPVRFGRPDEAGPDSALLIEGDAPAPAGTLVGRFVVSLGPHAAGCTCCAPRGSAARALGWLFLRHARNGATFREVVAVIRSPAGEAAVRAALAADPLASARFRLSA